MADDKNRLRKTYSFYRQQPVYATGGGGGGGGGGGDQFWYSTTLNSIYTTGSVLVRGNLTDDSSYDLGTGVFFYVSGTIGDTSSNKRISVFGGDLSTQGSFSATQGLSGSLTTLTNGSPYLIAGANITISSASNGPITITSTASGGAPTNAQYVTLATNGTLTDERVLTAGTGIKLIDAGAGNTVTLAINDSVVATISGSTFTGVTKHNAGLSGSLTRLTDGTSYLIAGNNVSITTGSNGAITISSSAVAGAAGNNTEIQFNNGGSFGASSNLSFNSGTNTFAVTGSFGMKGNIIPDLDSTYTLGTTNKRWAHVYTGDLHLRNERGDWTIVEEREYLCVVNNITGKKYKMMLQPIDEDQT